MNLSGFIFLLMTLSVVATAQTNKGYIVAKSFYEKDNGFGGMLANMEMILVNANGDQSKRKIRVKTKERANTQDSERTVLIFDYPHDVKGTVLLTASNSVKEDEQWIYFPSIGRVKRITANSKTGPFMGSEFSYEDLVNPELDKYKYKYVGEERCGAWVCDVIDRFSKDTYSGYSKQRLWIDNEEYRIIRVEYYDLKNINSKVLTIDDYSEYEGEYWRANRMEMKNLINGKSTILLWSNYSFSKALTEEMFNASRLKYLN